MAHPFTFVRNWFQRGQPQRGQLPPVLQKGRHRADAPATDKNRIVIEEPAVLGIAPANRLFYASVFGLPLDQPLPEAVAMSVPQKLVVDMVRASLSERESRTKAVPRLPSVIPKLLHSLRDPQTSAKDYVAIVNKDPALSAAVLRLANSVYFNPTGQRIDSINVAVVKLGIRGLRSVLSAAVMQPVVQRRSDYFTQFGQRLWEHTLACAVACEIIATARGLEPYKAYLLGLTHETGKITLFSELCKQFRRNDASQAPGAGAFIPLMMEKSTSLSAAIAMDWDLPKEICAALQQQVELTGGRRVSQYAHMLFQANLACEAFVAAQHGADIDLAALADALMIPASLFADLQRLGSQV